jgi:hypothetical protein
VSTSDKCLHNDMITFEYGIKFSDHQPIPSSPSKKQSNSCTPILPPLPLLSLLPFQVSQLVLTLLPSVFGFASSNKPVPGAPLLTFMLISPPYIFLKI